MFMTVLCAEWGQQAYSLTRGSLMGAVFWGRRREGNFRATLVPSDAFLRNEGDLKIPSVPPHGKRYIHHIKFPWISDNFCGNHLFSLPKSNANTFQPGNIVASPSGSTRQCPKFSKIIRYSITRLQILIPRLSGTATTKHNKKGEL